MKNKTIFKVGDAVYDILDKRYGKIIHIGGTLHVQIQAINKDMAYYSLDGTMHGDRVSRLIFSHQVKDLHIPRPERGFDLKDFLASVPVSELKCGSVYVVNWSHADECFNVYDNKWVNTIDQTYTEENAKKVAKTLNENNITFEEYRKVVIELMSEGVI